ncbi:conserved hypothetical protein [Gammaproteobacteria bacterium]
MLFSKSKSAADKATTRDAAQEGITLFLHLGTTGWRAQAFDPLGKPLKVPNAGESVLPIDGNESRTERMLRMALEGIPSGLRKRLKHCYLLLDSNDLIFVDTKVETLRAASPARVREFGRELLNCRDVAFGYTSFGTVTQGARSNGVYAFADTALLRKILGGLGDIAPKIREIIPTEVFLFKEAEAYPNEPYGAIFVGAEYTEVVLAHVGIGAVTVRHIPVGIATLVMAVAERTGTRPEEVLTVLKERDYLSDLTGNDRFNEHSLSPQEEVLMPLLRKLNDEIVSTLEYFRSQRACGAPRKIEIFGETKRIRGLDNWLRSGFPGEIQIEIKGSSELLFDTFIRRPFPIAFNLLKGTEGVLISVGKVKLSFSEKEGMVPSTRATKEVSSTSGGTTRTGARGRKRATQQKSRDQSGFLAELKKKFSFSRDEAENEITRDGTENEGAYFALLATFALLVLYFGYDQYSGFDKQFRSTTSLYSHNFDENNNLRQKIQRQGLISVSTGRENKVLWTEKFLAIGNHITENLWLSDIYLEGDSYTVGNNVLSSLKLVMKGAALPKSDGHVGVIADFVDTLMKDEPMFMSDFRDITFGGFTADTTDADPVVRFTLEAHYDPTKRKTITAVGEGNPIVNMQQAVDKRTLATEQAAGIKAR